MLQSVTWNAVRSASEYLDLRTLVTPPIGEIDSLYNSTFSASGAHWFEPVLRISSLASTECSRSMAMPFTPTETFSSICLYPHSAQYTQWPTLWRFNGFSAVAAPMWLLYKCAQSVRLLRGNRCLLQLLASTSIAGHISCIAIANEPATWSKPYAYWVYTGHTCNQLAIEKSVWPTSASL